MYRQQPQEEFDPWKQPAPKQDIGHYPAPKRKKRSLLPLLLLILAAAVSFSVFREEALRLLDGKSFQRLPSVPEALQEHTFLQSRDLGPCGVFQGDVGITVIFVHDADSGWTPEAISQYLDQIREDVQGISQDAALWGRELSLSLDTRECYIGGSVTSDTVNTHLDAILAAAGLPADGFHQQLEETLAVDQAPVVFVLNKPGRASAQMGSLEEFCFLFEDASAFRHELYHLFGAEDLYYPAEVTQIAESCFHDSIMLGYESDTVDDLTAYLMGWTNEVSAEALSFLEQTTWVTAESMQEAYSEESRTGYGTREYADGTYTGQMNMGVPHGWGKLTMNNGDSYEGEFANGVRHGTGTYRWSNGDVYQGPFVEDVRTGHGIFTWSNGDCYEGDFLQDVRTGWGVYTWADGTRYEGDFYADAMTGSGSFYWTDGCVYTGEFLNGTFDGHGTLTYPNGRSLSGTWHNGDYYGEA